MTLVPYLSAPAVIQFHIVVATLSLVLGPVALFRRRRDRVHKVLGYVWVAAMAAVALSAFFIHSFPIIGPFSPIHLLAVLTLWSLWTGVRAAIARDIHRHQIILRSLYWRGLIIAGLVNFMPGRATNAVFFEGHEQAGWVVIVLGGAMIVADVLRQWIAPLARRMPRPRPV